MLDQPALGELKAPVEDHLLSAVEHLLSAGSVTEQSPVAGVLGVVLPFLG